MEFLALIVIGGFFLLNLATSSDAENEKGRAGNVVELKPLLLRRSRLLLVEEWLELQDPMSIRSRVDEVYRQPNGELLILDTKVRKRPVSTMKDVIALSTYAYILRQMGNEVAPFGYLRIQLPDRVRYIKVALLSEHRLMKLVERARELDQKLTPPLPCGRRETCMNCDVRENCTVRVNQMARKRNGIASH